MLADELDYVVGVDTHRDEHVLAVVAAPAGAVVAKQAVETNVRGYREAFRFAERYASGARAWAIEGAGHYGAGLARYLSDQGEVALEISRTREPSGGCAAKTTRSTRSGRHGLRLPARRLRSPAPGDDGRPCGCC